MERELNKLFNAKYNKANMIMVLLHKICVWTQVRKIKRKSLMRDSDWLKLNLRLIFLICVQTQIVCNGANKTYDQSNLIFFFEEFIWRVVRL